MNNVMLTSCNERDRHRFVQEASGEGVTYENWHRQLDANDDYTFATVITFLLVDAVVYFLLAYYIEQVSADQAYSS